MDIAKTSPAPINIVPKTFPRALPDTYCLVPTFNFGLKREYENKHKNVGLTTQLNGRVTIGGAIGSMKKSRASYIISNNNRIIAPDMTKGYASKLIGSMNESRLSDSTTHDYAEFPLTGRHWPPAIAVGYISKPFSKTIPTLQNITTTANEGTLGWFNSKKEVPIKNLIKEI